MERASVVRGDDQIGDGQSVSICPPSSFFRFDSDSATYMKVYISSGKHIDNVSKRVDAINQHLDSPDVVFGEGGESDMVEMLRHISRVAPVAPLIALVAFIHLFIIMRLFGEIVAIVTRGKLGQDREIMRRVADQHGATIQEIDTFYSATPIHTYPILFGTLNWGAIILIPVGVWRFFPSFEGVVLLGLLLLLSGGLLLFAMLYQINEDRENRMVAEILSEADTLESACIVIGKGHRSGIEKQLVSHNEIKVINPTQTNINTLL